MYIIFLHIGEIFVTKCECISLLQGAREAFQDLIYRLQERNSLNDQDLEYRIYHIFNRLDSVYLILGENETITPIEVDLNKDHSIQYHQILDEIQRARRFLEIRYNETQKMIKSECLLGVSLYDENIRLECAVKILKRIT